MAAERSLRFRLMCWAIRFFYRVTVRCWGQQRTDRELERDLFSGRDPAVREKVWRIIRGENV